MPTILVSEITIGPAGITTRQWEVPEPLEPLEGWLEMKGPDAPPIPGFPLAHTTGKVNHAR